MVEITYKEKIYNYDPNKIKMGQIMKAQRLGAQGEVELQVLMYSCFDPEPENLDMFEFAELTQLAMQECKKKTMLKR